MGMQSDNGFPLRRGAGFLADVKTDGEQLRLFAQLDEEGWAATVYNMNTHKRILDGERADDAADAKKCAEACARNFIPGEYEIAWFKLPPAETP